MEAFEALISILLRHDGYWTTPNFKINLTKEDKRRIGLAAGNREGTRPGGMGDRHLVAPVVDS